MLLSIHQFVLLDERFPLYPQILCLHCFCNIISKRSAHLRLVARLKAVHFNSLSSKCLDMGSFGVGAALEVMV